mmetsp:Transcript_26012/g.54918  ORF Transcript_26012/g.54918 Transcript_26012/m.54918 type:complete len:525 (+) Transcript_26012:142-1716(+)|eukprot:CAMPEP_0183740108 /NCGR_PEP_ID=MMETSP0737-20130205/58779_1 /TAXON_ID=385413 /ORGANISM="Thalassiosira miniscula, Strain CCMP1093" /LENGTH=524 /DNA_ID=CAMNT_0025975093 /DNA_START=132 /DNA_END=1706 /DNA_ORIENTATION=-
MIANRLFAATRQALPRVPPASARFRLAPAQHLRFFADAIDFHYEEDDHEWKESFTKATVGVAEMDPKTIDHDTSAQRMRDLVRSGLLRHTDLRDNPERFFQAHRIIAAHTSAVGPGFWVRFTVHQNLCCGTILGLGNEAQVQVLDEMQEKGELGCFALTEKRAGVSSGLVVSTIAEYNRETNTFLLNSPGVGAQKNWISQGLVADKTVVVADLRIDGQSYGPHAFLMNLREGGELVQGVETFDMGIKTVGNDLDNAAIAFNNVILPKDALLSKFADIDESSGEYVQKVKGLPVFHMIGQRLFTGRVAVAQAAMEFRRGLFAKTKKFTDQKKCWSPNGDVTLSDIPHIKALYEAADQEANTLDAFLAECEKHLCDCLRNNKLPSLELVEAIACAKVKCVECSIKSCHQLQQDVGSYALMGGTGFENIDFLTCCKFAEGDSRILQQKMSRDRMKRYMAKEDCPANFAAEDWEAENQACANLQSSMLEVMNHAKVDKHAAWDHCWVDVYDLSEIIMARTMKTFMSSS